MRHRRAHSIAYPRRVWGLLLISAGFLTLYISYGLPGMAVALSLFEYPRLLHALLAIGIGAALVLCPAVVSRRRVRSWLGAMEVLFVAGLILLLFQYFFARNAGLEYVQRFQDQTGRVQLALDTRSERLAAVGRSLPLLLASGLPLLVFPIRRGYRVVSARIGRGTELPLMLLSVVLLTLSQPNGWNLEGLGWLGWIAMVPLLVVIRLARPHRAVLLGLGWGVLTILTQTFWLATFNLLSLQVTTVIYLVYYTVFFGLLILSRTVIRPNLQWILFALGWTVFEWVRSLGFLGFPWALVSHSLATTPVFIQSADIGGVWLVTFVVVLVNAALAELLVRNADSRGLQDYGTHAYGIPTAWRPLLLAGLVFALNAGYGAVQIRRHDSARAAWVRSEPESVRLALIQQSNDPRKASYRSTFNTLQDLTLEALAGAPDMVIWSETAFVPNIRRWSVDDGNRFLNAVVRDFLEFQRDIGTWLLTGNDDYEVVRNADGGEIDRLNYNAAVLFSDEGQRVATYRKMRLVPFTESFPFEEQFPGVYELLQSFDANLWEPGTEYTVFQHPRFRFTTPICFEDVFPQEVRRGVRQGLDVILNISNDYWSLTPVEGRQHFVAALFRAVETRRPLVRATSSGLTGTVSPVGRIAHTLPYYEPAWVMADVPLPDSSHRSPYLRFGDWFPVATATGILALLLASRLVGRRDQHA